MDGRIYIFINVKIRKLIEKYVRRKRDDKLR